MTRPDGTLVFAEVPNELTAQRAADTSRLVALAADTLARAGLGSLRRAAVEYREATVFVRRRGPAIGAASFTGDVEMGVGLVALDDLWSEAERARRVPA